MDKEDRISVLPDDLLLGIIQLLDLPAAVRAGALARRWRRLPRLLSDIAIDVTDLTPHPKDINIMVAYADAARWLLAPTEHRTIRGLRLAFYLADDPDLLRSIGHAVAESAAERWEFTARTTEVADHRAISREQRELLAALGPRLMSFAGACPVAFRRLTSLTLHSLRLRSSDIHHLLSTCERLELLSLHRCVSVGDSAVFLSVSDLQIDAPSSSLVALELRGCHYPAVQLTRVPNLERLLCCAGICNEFSWWTSLEFGHVPRLRDINLSTYHLRLYQHGNTSELSPLFGYLREIHLCDFNTHSMVWTFSVLQAAPFVHKLFLKVYHPCDTYPCLGVVPEEKVPKFEHHNLVLLEMAGYQLEEDTHVVQYIKLIAERAVCLKRVRVLQQCQKATRRGGVRSACLGNEAQEIRSRKAMKLADVMSSSTEVTVDWLPCMCSSSPS